MPSSDSTERPWADRAVPSAVRRVLDEMLAHLAEPAGPLPPPLAEGVVVVRSWLDAVSGRKRRFVMGRLCATPRALREIPHPETVAALGRHIIGDWGELDAHDWLCNDHALINGERLLSAYRTLHGRRFWIITEADRSVTTLLLPEEY